MRHPSSGVVVYTTTTARRQVMDRPSRGVIAIALMGAACSSTPRPAPQLAQNREVEGFAAAAAWPNAEPAVPIIAAQEFMASRHDRDGYEYFHRLAREQPDRPILTSLEVCCRRAARARFRSCSA